VLPCTDHHEVAPSLMVVEFLGLNLLLFQLNLVTRSLDGSPECGRIMIGVVAVIATAIVMNLQAIFIGCFNSQLKYSLGFNSKYQPSILCTSDILSDSFKTNFSVVAVCIRYQIP
jgi:hypothetical protein